MTGQSTNPSSTRKKVVVRQFDGETIKGFVDPTTYIVGDHAEILDREGHLQTIPLESIKGVYFVRDFDGDSNRQEKKVFNTRPRISGIWLRLTFKDDEVMEGLLINNLLDLEDAGFLVTPPDYYANNLRIFVPRNALAGVEALGVISEDSVRKAAQRAKRPGKRTSEPSRQIGLFPVGE